LAAVRRDLRTAESHHLVDNLRSRYRYPSLTGWSRRTASRRPGRGSIRPHRLTIILKKFPAGQCARQRNSRPSPPPLRAGPPASAPAHNQQPESDPGMLCFSLRRCLSIPARKKRVPHWPRKPRQAITSRTRRNSCPTNVALCLSFPVECHFHLVPPVGAPGGSASPGSASPGPPRAAPHGPASLSLDGPPGGAGRPDRWVPGSPRPGRGRRTIGRCSPRRGSGRRPRAGS